ncbi:hypothetical protein J3R83DRAFT_2268 [Lanmaoa asiatica]|nr:hypothetical protein J3R83DRAFT_2268 [Lanmaoa asiatica]
MLSLFRSSQYSAVDSEQPDEDESEQKLLAFNPSASYASDYGIVPRYKRNWSFSWLWIGHGVSLFLWVVLFVLWVNSRARCAPSPVYSPANEAVEYMKEIVAFNGTLGKEYVFVGPPSPEIDAAWTRVSTDIRPTRISLEQLERMGYSDAPSRVKFRDEDGGGYMAALEVAHQLHCVDFLRKYTHKEYYESWDISFQVPSPDALRTHLDHCIENLRQTFMCSADAGIIPYQWVVGHHDPVPDFRTNHKCRNFEKVIDWGYSHQVHIPTDHVVRFGNVIDLLEHP